MELSIKKIAVVIAGIQLDTCLAETSNLTARGSWSVRYVACAESKQWSLYSDGTVDVKRPATRAEVVGLILEAFQVPMQQWSGSGSLFIDVDASTQYTPAIVTAVLNGIITGYADANGNLTGAFGPQNPINRAELAKMLSIALQKYGS